MAWRGDGIATCGKRSGFMTGGEGGGIIGGVVGWKGGGSIASGEGGGAVAGRGRCRSGFYVGGGSLPPRKQRVPTNLSES